MSSTSTVLVVGASRGIGAGLVRTYLEHGWRVHATVRDPAAPGELVGLSGPLTVHRLDVRDVDRTNELATQFGTGELDTFIHNAGVYTGHPEAELIEVNAIAPIRTATALLDAAAVRDGGVVALMTSQLGARHGQTGTKSGYSGSKMRLNDEFRRVADDWHAAGALAVVIHPGWVRTAMGGPNASISVTDSASGIYRLLTNLTPNQHGRFWTWDGREHAW